MLLPVEHNNTILNFADENIIADGDNQIIAIGNCCVALSSTFCKKLPHSTCTQQIHSGIIAHCSTRRRQLEPLHVIDDGMVITDDQSAWIKASEGPTRNIKETFLIIIENDITINGTSTII